MIPIDQLTTPVTADQVVDTVLTTLESLSIPAKSWPKGGVARTIIRVLAIVFAGFSSLLADGVRAGFLDYATGAWLTMLAQYVYGVTRIDAVFATGKVTFVNTGGGSYTKVAREVRVSNPTTKKTYVNQAGFTLGPGATLTVDVIAEEQGSASSSAPGTVTNIDTTMLGVTVSNAAAIVGSDAELDPALVIRCRLSLGARSVYGPRSAYSFWGLSAPRNDGTIVDVNRVTVSTQSSTGTVSAYIASPSGSPTVGDVAYVQAAFEQYAQPLCVTAVAVGATAVALPLSGVTIWARKEYGAAAADIVAAATAALTDLAKTYPIGGLRKPPSLQGYLFADRMAAAIIGSHPAIYDVDGIGADFALSAGQVPVITAGMTCTLVTGVS